MFLLNKQSLIATALVCASGVAQAAGLYVYVDEQGVPHYALQPLNDKYKLFVNDDLALSDDIKIMDTSKDAMMANLPSMDKYGQVITSKPRTASTTMTGMNMSGLRIPAPSKATLSRLLRSPALARYEPLINRYARTYGVDVNLVKSVMAAESGFNPNAISSANAQGLMQVIPPTAARYGVTEAQLMIPERNIYAGVRYLADLSRMFKGRPELIIAAYNAGEGAVYKYKRTIPPYKETQNYVRIVLSYYSVYAPSGGLLTASVSDNYDSPVKNNRRSAQRVSMKIGGKLRKNAVVLD